VEQEKKIKHVAEESVEEPVSDEVQEISIIKWKLSEKPSK
jgi:hypothetical protein